MRVHRADWARYEGPNTPALRNMIRRPVRLKEEKTDQDVQLIMGNGLPVNGPTIKVDPSY